MATGGIPEQSEVDVRPKRTRTRNVRLAEYDVEIPPSIDPKSPVADHMRLLGQTIRANVDRIGRAQDLADTLLERGDINVTVLSNCYHRMESSNNSLIDAAENVMNHLEASKQLTLRAMTYKVRDIVEETMDDIALHLNEREMEQRDARETEQDSRETEQNSPEIKTERLEADYEQQQQNQNGEPLSSTPRPHQGRVAPTTTAAEDAYLEEKTTISLPQPLRRTENIDLFSRRELTPDASLIRGAPGAYVPIPDDCEEAECHIERQGEYRDPRSWNPPLREPGGLRDRTMYYEEGQDDMSISSLSNERNVYRAAGTFRGVHPANERNVLPQQPDIAASLVRTLEKLAANSEIPATPIMYFDGDSSDYPAFMKDFSQRVGSKPFENAVKLGQLIECTKGKAQDAVKVYRGQETGYQRAITTLKQRFGEPLQIVNALMAKLERQGRIRPNDADGLLQFADRLEAYYETFVEFRLMHEANTQTTIKRVFRKLPVRSQFRWISKVNDMEADARTPTFRHMVEFVRGQAQRSTHPVYQVEQASQEDRRRFGGRNEQGNQRGYRYQPNMVTTLATNMGTGRQPATGRGGSSGGSWTGRGGSSGGSWTGRGGRGGGSGGGGSWKPPDKTCDFCNRRYHGILDCPVFIQKSSQDRRNFVRNNKLCWCCLGRHNHAMCAKRDVPCNVNGCTGRHHPLIHISYSRPDGDQGSAGGFRRPPFPGSNWTGRRPQGGTNESRGNNGGQTTATNIENDADSLPEQTTATLERPIHEIPAANTFLRVVPVKVHSAETDRVITTYAMLDTGSTNSMVSQEIATALGVKGQKTEISLNTIVRTDEKVEVEEVSLKLRSVHSDGIWMEMRKAQIVPRMQLNPSLIPGTDVNRWEHLRGINLQVKMPVDVRKIGVLIGEDVPPAHRVLQEVYGDRPYDEPYAVLTPFGWTIAGPSGGKPRDQGKNHSHLAEQCPTSQDAESDDPASLEEAVNQLWNNEKHGFLNEEKSISEADQKALEKMENETYLDTDGKYVVPLLWRSNSTVLKNNYFGTLKYLQALQRKFAKRPEFESRYRAMIQNYVDKGYARRLTWEEAARTTPRTFYLPHQGVENPNKPGKVRVVFNAAYPYKGDSLNKALYHGPDLTNNMLGILLRFRCGKFALVADIQEMFHQVKVTDRDADSLRFLWYQNQTDEEPSIYRMERHIFGATDSPAICSYALKRTARDNREFYDKETIQTVERNMYVDDLVKACATEEETERLGGQLISLLDKGGFTLTKIMSNSKRAISALPPDRIAADAQEKALDDLPTQRTLGVYWDAKRDYIGVQVQVKEQQLTKRGCLSFLCSIFDIMGVLAPVILVGRRVLQQAMRQKLKWDDPLSQDLEKPWYKWRASLSALEEITIPRCFEGLEDKANIKSIQLHHFGDGSEYAYGEVSYLRVELKNGTILVSLVAGKARVAPQVFLSIPRIEMQAATVAARMGNFLKRELDVDVDATYYWTDSTATLGYIKNTTKRLKTYLANRKQEILDATSSDQWHYCPTKENPADIASRGALGHQLAKTMWFTGPDFLRNPMSDWPRTDTDLSILDECDPEIKKENTIAAIFSTCSHPTILDLVNKQSSWFKARKLVIWLTKFTQWMKHKADPNHYQSPSGTVTPTDLDKAESDVIRIVQKLAYESEYDRLSKGKQVDRGSTIRNLNPVLIDGILRVGGRLAEAPLSFEARHPAILPKCHPVVNAIIWSYHHLVGHDGPEHTLAEIRTKFWILGGKSTVKAVVSKCVPCRRKNATRINQIMSSLPRERVQGYQPPFTVTGCDVFGPLHAKRGRSTLKKYVVIFTCFSTRAVHLEIMESMTTDSFINALVRFTSRRVKPAKIFCDNGTNFVGGANELQRVIDDSKLQNYTLQKGIDFRFQTPTASHTSGVWERLVKSCKGILKILLGAALVSEETLSTTLAQVEQIMNSRPITPSSDSPDDYSCLTPNHLLLQCASDSTAWCVPDEADIYSKKWKQAQLLAQHYWDRWSRVYLPQLQKMSKWTAIGRDVKPGDLVMLCDDTVKIRGRWPMARVMDVQTGDDGHVRAVTVKTPTGVYKRPVQKLSLLEGVVE